MQLIKKRLADGVVILGLFFGLILSASAETVFKPPPWQTIESFYEMMDAEEKAEQGDVELQYYVAHAYYLGDEVFRDRFKAFHFYEKAANQGHAESQTNLALMYFEGQVVRQNLGEYIKWLRKSASQKNSRAQALLGDSYEFGRGVSRNYPIAKEWYGKSCDNGNIDGCQNYKRMNEKGR